MEFEQAGLLQKPFFLDEWMMAAEELSHKAPFEFLRF